MAKPTGKDKPDNGNQHGINAERVRVLARLLDETGLGEIEYAGDGWHVRVAKPAQAAVAGNTQPTAATGPAGPAAEPAPASHPGMLKSPMVGIVYTSADPAAPPFVRVGDTIAEGQTVLLIEAMKVFNPIKAPKAGKVTRILITSGMPVEYGEPLMIIE